MLQRCPRRVLAWHEDGEGRCVVLRPKLGHGRIARWLGPRLREPYYRIRLDEVGSHVWRACDGETPLGRIAGTLRERFGDRIEPADARLEAFVKQLLRARLVELGRASAVFRRES